MQGGNPAAVAAGRIDRGRVRDRVDCGDKEQQAKNPDHVLAFQNVLGPKEPFNPLDAPMAFNNTLNGD